MKNFLIVLVFLSVVISACGAAPTSVPTDTATPVPATDTLVPPTPTITEIPSPVPTDTPTLTPTPSYPPEGLGPANFPTNVDPLTGLEVANPALLDRRPMVIKVQNIPRTGRPQWGLSLADIVFEYYTEEGATRFAAIFYGNDADMVGPIRSGRFIDTDIVRGYKAVFAFGSAYDEEWWEYVTSDFANRLVVESSGSPMFRYEPNGLNYLMVKTSDLSAYATQKNMKNVRQNLDGMFFKGQTPSGGQPGTQVTVRYSGVIYNRWDYDASTGKYLRFSDSVDDYNNDNAQYAQLNDRLTDQPVAFENLVVLLANYKVYYTDSNGNVIYDIQLSGTGDAYAFRDGQVYQVKWQRNTQDVVSLANPDGTPFSFKPGPTFFEVVGVNSSLKQTDQNWFFTHQAP
jgi:hypothetical protein